MKNVFMNMPAASLCCAALFGAASSQAATITVTCPAQTLQSAIDSAAAGDTINVSGTCTENVIIRNEKNRVTINGPATLNAANNSVETMNIRGKGIFINSLTITGGLHGIAVSRAANAVIQNSNISGASGAGVTIHEMSFASLLGNTIHDNSGRGVLVDENSIAHIGFNSESDSTTSGNTITNNTLSGIAVLSESSAWIVGNTISNNKIHGIRVGHQSRGRISGNTINNNGSNGTGSGIMVQDHAAVLLGKDDDDEALPSVAAFNAANTTTVLNVQFGIKCIRNSVVAGHLGTLATQLNGSANQFGGGGINSNAFAPTCSPVSDLITP